ncbi:MAG: transglutaminase-like domain-containing protein [Planctomycetota bacterium]|nr:transglutaminase-like domain-containing protein [Planctomycetota bacterium]
MALMSPLRSTPVRLALLILALSLAPLARAASEREEAWYVVMMGDQRVGWMQSVEEREEDRIRTSSEVKLSIARGGMALSISMLSRSVETAEAEPISMETVLELGAAPTRTRYEFKDDTVTITTEAMGQKSVSEQPRPGGDWLPPAAAANYLKERLDAGATEVTVATIEPLVGLQPTYSTLRLLEKTTIEALGKRIPALKWSVEQAAVQGDAVQYTDLDGVPVRMEMDLGVLSMTIIASEKELALSPLEPAEIMANTLVKPDRPIQRPRHTTTAVYRLSVPDGDMPEIPTQGPQRAERIDDRAVRLTVDINNPAVAPDADDPRWLDASSMIDAEDDSIVELTRRALRGAPADPAARAERLRAFVHDYMDLKNLGVGLATATQACQTREGDCTEHGVLLAAMLRADGIPARVATGLLYIDEFIGAEQIFGYHMWSQALLTVDGAPRWVDFDATLPGDNRTDATHIALSTSALEDGALINSMAAMAPVFGRLKIEVESIE